jgi:diguanylate cyclase (GGDEF)-like protein
MIGNYKIIALCTCRIQDKESHNFIETLNLKLNTVGCRLFIYNTCWITQSGKEDSDAQLSIYDLINSSFVDAVIVQADRIENRIVCQNIIDKSLAQNLPVITLGMEFENVINIKYNHQAGFRDIINHIIDDHNITDLHMIAGFRNNIYSDERIEVFKNALRDHGLPYDENTMLSYGDFWPGPAKEALRKLIKENRVPKAIICANDNMAIAVVEELKENGYKVPQDCVVTGFDCTDAIYSCDPTITSAAINPKISGQAIFNAVIEVLNGGQRVKDIVLNSVMITNESCGCNCSYKINLTEYLNEQNSVFCHFQDDNIALSYIGSKIQLCSSFEEIPLAMHSNDMLFSMSCVLKAECIDERVDPSTSKVKGFNNKAYILYDSDEFVKEEFNPDFFNFNSIIPNLEDYLDNGRYLVFTPLHYLDVPLGYICFHFDEYIESNYVRIPQIINTLNTALGGVRNLRHSKYLMKQIEIMYRRDPLTGLYNRRGFMIEYDKLLANRDNRQLCVVICDLDGLKKINDTYGHEEGDIAIHVVGRALKHACPDSAICTRFGGDEMLAVFIDDENHYDVHRLFNEYIDRHNKNVNKKYKVSASLGIYHTKNDEDVSFESLIKYTDNLMYQEKNLKKKM